METYSRRDVLRLGYAGVMGTLLAACQPKVVEVEKIVKETVVIEKEAQPAAPSEKIVRILLSSWAVDEIPFDAAAREFNSTHPGIRIVIETAAEGWENKVLAQISQDDVQWCAAGIMSTTSSAMPVWILTDMIQPMDDYIAVSKEQGASELLSDMIDTVRKASEYNGEFYGIPYSFENITFNWRTDYFAEVGAGAPDTFDDWVRIAKDLKKWGAEQQIFPTSFTGGIHTDIVTLLYGSTDQPYTPDGLINWESPEMIEALTLYKKMIVEDELTPPHGSDGWLDAYYGGKVASVQAQSSRGVWGQRAFGTDKVATSPVPTKEKGKGSGTVFWGNAITLINKAPFAQEATDYLIYTAGPQNLSFQKDVIRTGKTPVYDSAYDKIINTDPQFRTYQWMMGMREQVARSIPRPFNQYWSIQDSVWQKYRVLFTEAGSTMTPEECSTLILKDALDEIAKQKV